MPDTAEGIIRVRTDGPVTVVNFSHRRIMDENLVAQIAKELDRLLDVPPPLSLLLDFEGVEHLSSGALGMLIILSSNIRKRGGRLKISRLHPQIRDVFDTTRLNKLFEIYENNQQAVAGFQPAA